jgi:hypothetical protein
MWSSSRGISGRDPWLELNIRAKIISMPSPEPKAPEPKPSPPPGESKPAGEAKSANGTKPDGEKPAPAVKKEEPPAAQKPAETDCYSYVYNQEFQYISKKVIRRAVKDIEKKFGVTLEKIHSVDFRPGCIDMFAAFKVVADRKKLSAFLTNFSDRIKRFEEEITKKLEHRLREMAKFRVMTVIYLSVPSVEIDDGNNSKPSGCPSIERIIILGFVLLILTFFVYSALFVQRPPTGNEDATIIKKLIMRIEQDISFLRRRFYDITTERRCVEFDRCGEPDCCPSRCNPRDGGRGDESEPEPCPLK